MATLQVDISPARQIEARIERRFPLTAAVRLAWIGDERGMRYASAQGLDYSEIGLGLQMQERLRESALVHLELEDCRVSAVGRVRNCVRNSGGWRVGIELTSPLLNDRHRAVGLWPIFAPQRER